MYGNRGQLPGDAGLASDAAGERAEDDPPEAYIMSSAILSATRPAASWAESRAKCA